MIENLAITEKTPSELEGFFFCSSCLAIGNATGNTALSSSWSELDGYAIALAGGTVHVTAIGTTTSRDAQPASAIGNSAAQSFILSEVMRFLLGGFGVDIVPGLFGDLLLHQCSAHLISSRIADSERLGARPHYSRPALFCRY